MCKTIVTVMAATAITLLFAGYADPARAAELHTATFANPITCSGQYTGFITLPFTAQPVTIIGGEIIIVEAGTTLTSFSLIAGPDGEYLVFGGQRETHSRVFYPAGAGYPLPAGGTLTYRTVCTGAPVQVYILLYYTAP